MDLNAAPTAQGGDIEIPEMPRPGAGAGSGYGEALTVDGATGSVQFSVPLFASRARALTPSLSLSYSSSRDNGLFGIGFGVDLPAISRRSSLGIPRYDAQDQFVTETGDVLVPRYDRDAAGRWQESRWHTEEHGHRYEVRAFRRRIESRFDRIECWMRDSDSSVFWKITDSQNVTSIYGETADARLADPRDPARVFRWMLQRQFDSRGNRAEYCYRVEQRDDASSLVPLSIAYGNFQEGQQEAFAFMLRFLYDLGDRPDPQRNYRAGFAVLTRLRCTGFSVEHYFPDELGAQPLEISRTELTYDDSDGFSCLRSLRRIGRRHEAGRVVDSALPPLAFAFHRPAASATFEPLRAEGPLPPVLPRGGYSFVDLHGDGLAGVLADRAAGRGPRYWSPLGDGRYEPGNYVPLSPVTPLDQPGRSMLIDMTGTGRRDSLLLSANRAGFYGNNEPGWDPYLPLQSSNTALTLPSTLMVDLSGSGRLGLLSGNSAGWQYCASLGREGFAAPIEVQSPPEMPLYQSDSEAIYIGFLNIFDDGLSHLVEAGSGFLRVWPSTGYGRFDPPLTVSGMPELPPSVGAAQLLFADLTGLGGVDLAIVHPDRIDIYLNHYGRSLTWHASIRLPADFGALDAIQASDVLGLGVSQLVLSYAEQPARNEYLDLNGGPQPWLLAAIDNGMGVATRFQYRSSVDYSLADKARGRPWLTRMPFPRVVVSRVEQDDAISLTRSVQVMQYAEGYFDPIDRQFTGFAWSQQQNDLAIDPQTWHFPCADAAGYRERQQLDLRAHARSDTATAVDPGTEPRLVRGWQYVGDWEQASALRERMLADAHARVHDTLVLPAPVLAPAFADEPVASVWLAWRALATRTALAETYAVDADGTTRPEPIQASQQAWGVELVQPALDGHSAVVVVCEREAAQSQFDSVDDPLVAHQVQTSFSELCQVLQRVEIAYPRRPAEGRTVLPAQALVQMRLNTSGFINHLDGEYRNANGGTTPPLRLRDGLSFHATGQPFESQSFELSGHAAPSRYYTYADVAAIVDACLRHVVPFGEPFTGQTQQARLLSWHQTDYWDGATPAPPQRLDATLCMRRQPQACFPTTFVSRYLQDRVDAEYLASKGAYRLAEGYWWSDGQTVTPAGASGYFQPLSYTNPFGAIVALRYDRYQLLMTGKTDPLGHVISADNDYQALAPHRLVDENLNVREYRFDGLAEVVVSTQYGEVGGEPVGNLPLTEYQPLPTPTVDALLADPGAYLQGASHYWLYRLDAQQGEPALPVYTVELTRRTFVNPASGNRPDDIAIRVRYFDGQLRDLATIDLVSGTAPYSMSGALRTGPHSQALVTGAPSPGVHDEQDAQWIVSDQERHDRQGNAIVRYQPYFANLPVFQSHPDAPFWTMRYDSLDRMVQGQTPDGFLTSTEYEPWLTRYRDQDDTVLQSPYYQSHINDPTLPATERDALEMAATFADTPVTVEQDGFSRQIQDENVLRRAGEPQQLLRNYHWYDAKDRLVALADPRFYNEQDPDQPRFYNFFVQHDMVGQPAWQKSADAGNLPLRGPDDGLPWLRLFDATGALIDAWDRRGIRHHHEYNLIGQPVSLQWQSQALELDCLAVRYEYGQDACDNTVNRLVLQQDQAGEQKIALYSLLGDATWQSRQFVAGWDTLTDWRTTPVLEPVIWRWENRQNARGEPTGYLAPNGCETAITLSRNGWPRQLALTLAEASDPMPIANIDSFTPAGAARRMTLANGARIEHEYDDTIMRLRRVRTDAGGTTLQDIAYTYDPVGNTTNLANAMPPAGATAGPVNYESRYDSLYRLTHASGLRIDDNGPPTLYRRQYFHDFSGNLTRVLDAAGPAWSREFRISQSANHAIVDQTPGDPDAYYDADGHLTQLPDQTTLVPGPDGSLQRARSPNGTSTWMQYTDQRVRLRRVSAPVTGATRQTYYLDPYIAEGDPDADASLSFHLGGLVVGSARFPAGSHGRTASLQFQSGDRLNSVVLRLDEQAAVIEQQEFYPYGATAFDLQSSPLPDDARRFQFTGQEKDPSTGLYSFPERYFSPELSRWISPDPAGTVDGSNLFAYVRNNPLTLNDPTGECGQPPQQKKANDLKKKFQGTAGSFAFFGLIGNMIGEGFSGALKLHHPPMELLFNPDAKKLDAFKAANVLKLANIAGFSAVFGGYSGLIYHTMNLKKYGFNIWDTSSIIGHSLFVYEGISIYRALSLPSHHDFHAAHARIGRIGAYSDLFKLPYYVKNGETDKVFLYSGAGIANWRSSVSDKVAQQTFNKLFTWLVSPYNFVASARNYRVIGKDFVQSAAFNAAKVQAWHILIFAGVGSWVLSQYKPPDKKH